MRLFGLEVTTRKRHLEREKTLEQVTANSGWHPLIREPYAGGWQLNGEISAETQLSFHAVYSCITLIANDIGKLRIKLMRKQDGIKTEIESSGYQRLLKKPNNYQNHIQFKEWWMLSKLTRGNTYGLKQRGANGAIQKIHLMDPTKVRPLVADDGSVFYELSTDNLSGIKEDILVVPATEIIHDRMNCLFHPLVGISPLYSCGLASAQGLAIQQNSKNFFANGSRPGGILTAPGALSDETANRLKEHWEKNYSGDNTGRVAVVGDGLKYEPLIMTAVDAQMVENLKMTAETVCSVFHVPSHMALAGQTPNYNNIEALNLQYYSQCLQSHIEQFEAVMDEGLGLPRDQVLELDLDSLLRMDTETQAKVAAEEIGAGYLTPDEARRRRNLPPVPGGNTPYMQQQNYSLAALARRDSAEDPFNPGSDPEATPDSDPEESLSDEEALEAMSEGAEE